MPNFNDLPREIQIMILGKAYHEKKREQDNMNYHIERFRLFKSHPLTRMAINNPEETPGLFRKCEALVYFVKSAIYRFMEKNENYLYGLDINLDNLEEYPEIDDYDEIHYEIWRDAVGLNNIQNRNTL